MANEVQYLTIGSNTYSVGGLALNIIKEESGSTITYTLDKTVSEIVEALNSGISPVFIDTSNDSKGYYPLKFVSFTPSTWLILISCTGYSNSFKGTGASAYPSFTQSSGGGND